MEKPVPESGVIQINSFLGVPGVFVKGIGLQNISGTVTLPGWTGPNGPVGIVVLKSIKSLR